MLIAYAIKTSSIESVLEKEPSTVYTVRLDTWKTELPTL